MLIAELPKDILFEILNNTHYNDIPSLCRTNRAFANFCQSSAGMKIINRKRQQLKEARVDQFITSLKNKRDDLSIDRFIKGVERYNDESNRMITHGRKGYPELIPKDAIERYKQLRRTMVEDFMNNHPLLSGRPVIDFEGNPIWGISYKMSKELYEQVKPEIENLTNDIAKEFLLQNYSLLPTIEQLAETYIVLF